MCSVHSGYGGYESGQSTGRDHQQNKSIGKNSTGSIFLGKGELCVRDGEAYVEVKKGQGGYVLYGPYQEFPAGNYEVKFETCLSG